jgi:hypothetical protein
MAGEIFLSLYPTPHGGVNFCYCAWLAWRQVAQKRSVPPLCLLVPGLAAAARVALGAAAALPSSTEPVRPVRTILEVAFRDQHGTLCLHLLLWCTVCRKKTLVFQTNINANHCRRSKYFLEKFWTTLVASLACNCCCYCHLFWSSLITRWKYFLSLLKYASFPLVYVKYVCEVLDQHMSKLSISTYLYPYLTIKGPNNKHYLSKKCLEIWQHRALVLVVSRYVLRWRPSRTILFEIVYWRFKALMNATLTFVMSCPIVKMHSWPLENSSKKFGSFKLRITVNKVTSTMNLIKM